MICFAWAGFPQYAARCIRTLVDTTKEEVVVVATKPKVPIEGMDALCGCKVIWIEYSETRPLVEILAGRMPRVLFVTGWKVRVFQAFRDQVKGRGSKVVSMVDNNQLAGIATLLSIHGLKLAIRETMKALRFKFLIKGKFDAYFVPGKSGEELLSNYGVHKNQIVHGLYSADSTLFSCDVPLSARKKKIIYVGQYIERKNVLPMVEAFAKAVKIANCKGWALELYGSGSQREELNTNVAVLNEGLKTYDAKISVSDFVQPEHLAMLYKGARALCLPSLEEHWGLVVHEAALSGCMLLLSRYVGASEDLVLFDGSNGINGKIFDPYSSIDIKDAFVKFLCMTDAELDIAQKASLAMAAKISKEGFAKSVIQIVEGIKK